MGDSITEVELFEKQFLELIEELQIISSSESRLRDALRSESNRAETAEAARDAATRAAAEARSSAAAATANACQAAAILAKVQDELVATKMQFELAERHRAVLEDKCSEMSAQMETLNKELQKLRPLQPALSNLQSQYAELQERIHTATENVRKETSRLETELRRVEKCAAGGAEIRERARLAAAAHVRERRLAAAQLQHTSHQLHRAKAEVTRLGALAAELQCRLSNYGKEESAKIKNEVDPSEEALAEARAALEAEQVGTARLERALAASLATNAALTAQLHSLDNTSAPSANTEVTAQPNSPRHPTSVSTNICQIDSFLAD